MMVKIAVHMERNIDYNGIFRRRERSEEPDITNAISHATCMTAIDLKANAILAGKQDWKYGTYDLQIPTGVSDRRLLHALKKYTDRSICPGAFCL